MSELLSLRRRMNQRLRERELEEQEKAAELTGFFGKLCKVGVTLVGIGLFIEWFLGGLLPHLLKIHG